MIFFNQNRSSNTNHYDTPSYASFYMIYVRRSCEFVIPHSVTGVTTLLMPDSSIQAWNGWFFPGKKPPVFVCTFKYLIRLMCVDCEIVLYSVARARPRQRLEKKNILSGQIKVIPQWNRKLHFQFFVHA